MENNRKAEAEKIVKEMNEDKDLLFAENLIRDNKIEFEYEDKKYRIRLLTIAEKNELERLRTKKFGQLIQDKDILFEKDLIKVLKERGIDVDAINDEIKKLDAEEISLQVKLGESISKNEGEIILKSYKEQIEELRKRKAMLNTQKTLLLRFSFENQLLNYVSMVITYLSLDELKDGTWQRMFSTLEDFENYDNGNLINKAAIYSMTLQYI